MSKPALKAEGNKRIGNQWPQIWREQGSFSAMYWGKSRAFDHKLSWSTFSIKGL